MIKAITLTTLAAATALSAVAFTPANAQVDVYVVPSQSPTYVPPRSGPLGDRDRDGVPNIADNYNNNRAPGMGDRDRDGIPNRWDRDKDNDGVPNRYDDRPNNPYRQ